MGRLWLVTISVAFAAAAFVIGVTLARDDEPAKAERRAVPPVRPGFEPAPGWQVESTGPTTPPQAPTTFAANVPIDHGDEPGGIPRRTVAGLPADGIVVYASFIPLDERYRGNAPPRQLPLRLAESTPVSLEGMPQVPARRTTAKLDGYEVDLVVFFGSEPGERLLAEADAELGRLVPPD